MGTASGPQAGEYTGDACRGSSRGSPGCRGGGGARGRIGDLCARESGRPEAAGGILHSPTIPEASVFIEEYLQELRQRGFTPRAFVGYGRSVIRRIRENLEANPGAVRAAWNMALAFFAVAFVGCAALALGVERSFAYRLFTVTAVWIAVTFAIVTASVDLLRDPQGYRLSSLNVPIALTLARVVMIPAILMCLIAGHVFLALGLYVFAALSDVADGWIARHWRQATQLGTVMDPVVDIFLNLALFAGLAFGRLLPAWVFWIAVVRTCVLMVGAAGLYLFVGPVRIRPTTLGRLMGVLTAALAGLLMLLGHRGGHWAERLVPLTGIALGALLSAGVLHALALGWYNLRLLQSDDEARRGVVGDVRWGRR